MHDENPIRVKFIFLWNYSTYLKFWNARAREREPYGVKLFFSAIRKIQFLSDRDDFFFAVVIIGSNKLIFSDFSYQGENRFKMDPETWEHALVLHAN